jgi:hypothetical protein
MKYLISYDISINLNQLNIINMIYFEIRRYSEDYYSRRLAGFTLGGIFRAERNFSLSFVISN